MNTDSASELIRRIVVALDSSAAGPPALDIAVRLAAALGAELEGVFVEDINLLRASGLPFLREVHACSLVEQAISSEGMQRDLRVLARQAEQQLVQASRAAGVRCTFRVWRGHPGVESFSSSFAADVLSLGGIAARLAYRTMPLLTRRAPPAIDAISVLYSTSPGAHKALATACHLATILAARIRVLLPADADPLADLEQQAAALLATHTLRASFLRIEDDSPARLADSVGRSASTVLIAEVGHPVLRRAGLARCLEMLAGPVLFVR